MSIISRNTEAILNKTFDAIIIGGGIYGVMLSLVASQRGLKTLLLEKEDFGGATSYNSLRIVHGGLRYLQKLDFNRFFESVSERKWFLKNFPDLVEPLACLMPLYGNGVYRPFVFRIALLLNDILSAKRNKGISPESKLPGGKIISTNEIINIFPDADILGLKGGAVWFDGSMPDSQRIVVESLKWSCSLGASAFNYFEVTDLILENNKISGLTAYDKENRKYYNFKSKIVINAGGPWNRKIAAHFDRDYKELFQSSIGWNILFNKKALSSYALAIRPRKPNSNFYFLRPWKGMLFAGTVHEPWNDMNKEPIPSENSINNFIEELNSSINNLNLNREDILQIYSGLLPAKKEGSKDLIEREIIIDHAENKGPAGLYSISGVKFTTARLVAEKTINKIFQNIPIKYKGREKFNYLKKLDFNWYPDNLDEETKGLLNEIIFTESVQHLDDLILRRTSLGDNPKRAMRLAKQICSLFGWDENKTENEINRLNEYYLKSCLSKAEFNS